MASVIRSMMVFNNLYPLLKQSGKLWNQGSSEQHDTGTGHELFNALALGAG